MNKEFSEPRSWEEKRRHKRLNKNFIMTYYEKSKPNDKYEMTQLKNISMGGLCFVTTKGFAPGTTLGIDLHTPYLSDVTHLEGVVLESHEKVKGILYETRIQLSFLDVQAEYLMAKLIEFFMHNGDKKRE